MDGSGQWHEAASGKTIFMPSYEPQARRSVQRAIAGKPKDLGSGREPKKTEPSRRPFSQAIARQYDQLADALVPPEMRRWRLRMYLHDRVADRVRQGHLDDLAREGALTPEIPCCRDPDYPEPDRAMAASGGHVQGCGGLG